MTGGRRVVLVLSGGGAKAIAHVGAVRVLTEAGLAPTHFVATSMGAVVAAGLAAGLSIDDLLERAGRIGQLGLATPAPLAWLRGLSLPALLRGEPLRHAIGELLPARRFADLQLPLTVTAVDRRSGELLLFGAGGQDAPLVDVLYASCALPVFYPAGRIGGREVVDGGLRGTLPLAAAAGLEADLVIAVDVGPGFDEVAGPPRERPLPPLIQAHNDSTGILMAALTAEQLAAWRSAADRPRLLYVRPRVEKEATFRVDRLGAYAAEGERAMRAALAERG